MEDKIQVGQFSISVFLIKPLMKSCRDSKTSYDIDVKLKDHYLNLMDKLH